MACNEDCVHYQLTGGQILQVSKSEPFDYCTGDPDEES